MQKTNDERTHLWDERAAPVIELTGMRAESNSRGCIVRRALRAHRRRGWWSSLGRRGFSPGMMFHGWQGRNNCGLWTWSWTGQGSYSTANLESSMKWKFLKERDVSTLESMLVKRQFQILIPVGVKSRARERAISRSGFGSGCKY